MKKIIIIFFIASIFLFPLASASTTLQIQPASKVLEIGETFNITISILPDQPVDTVAVDLLEWSAGVIDCISVQKGNMFPSPLIWMSGKINNTAGRLQYLVMASNEPTSQENSLCTITFQAKNEGISAISIVESGIARNGTPLPKTILNSCQLTVGSIIPPPNNSTNSSSNSTQTNQTEPVDNTTQPVDTTPPGGWFNNNTSEDEPLIPINQNNTNNSNTNTDAVSPGLFDNIPPTTIIYAIVAIIIISTFALITVRHFQHRQEDKDDEESGDAQGFTEDDDSGYAGGPGELDVDVWG